MIKEVVSLLCYHCGEECRNENIQTGDKIFCCVGCKSVYQLLHQNNLDQYYCLNETPGQTVSERYQEKFRFLEEEQIIARLISFRNQEQTRVVFYLPQIHCSSCLWLLENLSQLHKGIIAAQVNFTRKEITIAFKPENITLRNLAELLASIGYEPHISLQDNEDKERQEQQHFSRRAAYKLGITGFCFANIMLISFPEYLGMEAATDPQLTSFFRLLNILLALPVIGYGAQEFFRNAWYSFQQKYINIDAPIALAITVTFCRSLYEIGTQTGAGYLDSMSGIVFFMLLGRTLQNRAYSTLKFNRDYKSYFPVAVLIWKNQKKTVCQIQDIQQDDLLLLHHGEIVPTDCLLSKGQAELDYSFITGETQVEKAAIGDIVYAGARIAGAGIEVIAIKPFSQNSFTRLWNNTAFSDKKTQKKDRTTQISKYFSLVVFIISFAAFTYWYPTHPANAWNALTAVLIIACPCALLLTSSFTNGYLIDHLSQQGFFVKNADVLETLSRIDSIAFDKTGTLTQPGKDTLVVQQMDLNEAEKDIIFSAMAQSLHPLSKATIAYFNYTPSTNPIHYKEYPGKGIEVADERRLFRIGSRTFVTGEVAVAPPAETEVWIGIDGHIKAHFQFRNSIQKGVAELLPQLEDFHIFLISGDQESSKDQMRHLFGSDSTLLFRQSPEQKLHYIQELQQKGHKVMMVGDGLNDAGALQQSDVGIAIVQNSFSFSPASDVIMAASRLGKLAQYIRVAKTAQNLILWGFLYSILFNIVGICFAVTANLFPMIAAILMPSSSLGIMLIAYMGIRFSGRNLAR